MPTRWNLAEVNPEPSAALLELARSCRRGTKLSVLHIFWDEEWAATCREPRVIGEVKQVRERGTKLRIVWSVDGEAQTNKIDDLAMPSFDLQVHEHVAGAQSPRRAPQPEAGGEDGDTADEQAESDAEDWEDGDDDDELVVGEPPSSFTAHDVTWTHAPEHVRQDKFTGPKRSGHFKDLNLTFSSRGLLFWHCLPDHFKEPVPDIVINKQQGPKVTMPQLMKFYGIIYAGDRHSAPLCLMRPEDHHVLLGVPGEHGDVRTRARPPRRAWQRVGLPCAALPGPHSALQVCSCETKYAKTLTGHH